MLIELVSNGETFKQVEKFAGLSPADRRLSNGSGSSSSVPGMKKERKKEGREILRNACAEGGGSREYACGIYSSGPCPRWCCQYESLRADYNALEGVTRVGCKAHVKRGFIKALGVIPKVRGNSTALCSSACMAGTISSRSTTRESHEQASIHIHHCATGVCMA